MNIKKVTEPIKAEILLLYKQQFPIFLIAKLFGFSAPVISRELDQELKAENPKALNKKKLHVLKLYAKLLFDEAAGVQSNITILVNKKEIIFDYLGLRDWEMILTGIIAYKNLSESNRFGKEVSGSDRKIINEIFPGKLFEKPASLLLKEGLRQMHAGQIPFPEEESIQKPEKILTSFIEKKLLSSEFTNRIFTGEFIQHFKVLAKAHIDQRDFSFLQAFVEGTLKEKADESHLTLCRARQLKSRAVVDLRALLVPVLNRSFGGHLGKELEIEDLQHELKLKNDEFVVLQKHFASEDIGLVKSAILKIILTIPLEGLGLSVTAYNCLKKAKIESLPELLSYKEETLLKFRYFGEKSLSEIKQNLQGKGLYFGMPIPK